MKTNEVRVWLLLVAVSLIALSAMRIGYLLALDDYNCIDKGVAATEIFGVEK